MYNSWMGLVSLIWIVSSWIISLKNWYNITLYLALPYVFI